MHASHMRRWNFYHTISAFTFSYACTCELFQNSVIERVCSPILYAVVHPLRAI